MEIIRKLRVSFGYLSSILLIVTARPTSLLMFYAGAAVAVLGELIRVWASCYIIKLDKLTTDGPYRATRNPLYLGSFILMTGLIIVSMNPPVALLCYALFAVIYPFTIKAESMELEKKFGDYYLDYCSGTPVFFPSLKSLAACFKELKNAFTSFKTKVANFWKNREYNGIIALVVVLALLYYKFRRGSKK
ncbi:MAG TPA: isoprenylcysteine carboxylmethyltransferase family protein [Candidatus Wallbacteria bacterium]|nr:isoprenylcysteine carboxylmethyltransferase family protein [Candidatus Wallbacteria bacterium]